VSRIRIPQGWVGTSERTGKAYRYEIVGRPTFVVPREPDVRAAASSTASDFVATVEDFSVSIDIAAAYVQPIVSEHASKPQRLRFLLQSEAADVGVEISILGRKAAIEIAASATISHSIDEARAQLESAINKSTGLAVEVSVRTGEPGQDTHCAMSAGAAAWEGAASPDGGSSDAGTGRHRKAAYGEDCGNEKRSGDIVEDDSRAGLRTLVL